MSHFLTKCSCGAVISQCRCPGPKVETTVENGCPTCHLAEENIPAEFEPHHGIWRIKDEKDRYILIDKAQWDRIHSIVHDHYHGED